MPTTAADRAAATDPANRPRSFTAEFAHAPASVNDQAYVLIPGMDGGMFEHGPCTWQPRISEGGNAMLPKQGDACTVLDDDDGEWHIVMWWDPSATELPSSGPGVLEAHEWDQTTAANPWVIPHSLGRFPVGFQTFDSYGEQVEGDVVHTTSTTTVTWSGAMSGRATYL